MNRHRNKVAELQAAGEPVPEELLVVLRDLEKEPTQLELDALLPHPSLVQAVEELEREQVDNDIPIDPQILADNPQLQQITTQVEVSSESEEGEEYEFDHPDLGDESAESITSDSSSDDDSMNTDF